MLKAYINGDRIRQARLAAGMSQLQLARAIRSSEKNISRWENGQNQPRIESAAAIAAATGHDLDFFLAASTESDEEEEDADAMAALTRALRAVVREELKTS